MSIARQLLNEFRPLFRMLDEPLGRVPASFYGVPHRSVDPFSSFFGRPAVDVREEGGKYILDADLPGVKKENLDVRIGDNGHSVTIEGKFADREKPEHIQETTENGNGTPVAGTEESPTHLSLERPYTRNISFSRTVWLPQPIDMEDVSAKLDHGVLTISVNKAEDKASRSITIK